eukprot:CAMPEP_0113485968 /NCGR_PEP_ID=MMETSP0014_2-20120614/24754_1 /TAXON_ID=2857 /ORGANISM="Nitzschia sp." /LENGTH=484 /DNA_ID=CAMNT_0000379625 /DNA_START=72 /DNA_END=1526 /DNA_ORIENTATION=+ /assembly_acc=CAM_ASM_000159
MTRAANNDHVRAECHERDYSHDARQGGRCRRSSCASRFAVNSNASRSWALLLLISLVAIVVIPTDNDSSMLNPVTTASFMVAAQDAQESSETADATTTTTANGEEGKAEDDTASKKSPKAEEKDTFNAKEHMDWGTYYDPKNIFCGQYDCYQILGFDYENYGKEKPSTKVITKRYRALSREWHPDKSKHKDAKDRFTKIARAYEVLTNIETRKEYDSMRYDFELYVQKYGTNVLWEYAPKSNTVIVVLFILAVFNAFGLFAQYNKWQNVADRLVKAAVEEWSPSQGGTPESKELREHAITILTEREQEPGESSDVSSATKKGASKKGAKLTAKEKKQKLNDDLRPIIKELAYEIEDFGASFHKPTWKDLIIVKLVFSPYHFAVGLVWQVGYWIRRLQKKELNDEEKTVLTERAVGHVTWELASEEDRKAMIERKLWILDNLAEFKDEQEFASLSKTDQKNYKRYVKRNKGERPGRSASDLMKED